MGESSVSPSVPTPPWSALPHQSMNLTCSHSSLDWNPVGPESVVASLPLCLEVLRERREQGNGTERAPSGRAGSGRQPKSGQ